MVNKVGISLDVGRSWRVVPLYMPMQDSFSVRLGDRGRLVLPAEFRQRLDLKRGDRLIFTMEPDGSVRMTTAAELARRLRGAFAAEEPERSLVDELIAERREEARREEAEL